MSDETRIDHRDQLGEQRDSVFSYVQNTLNFEGERPTEACFFYGDWVMAFYESYAGKESVPHAHHSFHEDGMAPCKALDSSYDNPQDRWVFHEDKSLSIWTYINPMPEYGIDEPTYQEDRFHALKMNEKKFVLFNGDASIIMIFAKFNVAGE